MAHGQRPGTISRVLAPSPPPCPRPGLTHQSQEEQTQCTLKDNNNEQLTPRVSANKYLKNCDPSREDMEDTCSEYDNVGSDVEQDCDEVLHLSREGVVDMRYYKQYCPGDGNYVKHADDNVTEGCRAVDQFIPRPRRGTEVCEGSQPDTEPCRTGRRFNSHRAPIAGEEAEGEVGKGQENRYFLCDMDEIEEVLDGAKFIEDMEEEETETGVERQTGFYHSNDSDRIRNAGGERERDDGHISRNHNIQGAGKKLVCESSHMGSKEKERQGKGRGRRGTGEDVEHIATGMKGCMSSSAEQRPQTLSKDCKKAAVRTKARPGATKSHPPAPPRQPQAQMQAGAQKALQHRRETPPVPRTSPPAHGQESHPRVIKPPLAPHHTPEPQRETIEDSQRQLEKPQQVTDANRAGFVLSHPPGGSRLLILSAQSEVRF